MFEAGKKYIFSRTKFIDDMLTFTSLLEIEKHRQLFNTFDGTKFIGRGENRRDLYKDGYTFTVFPEWCVKGDELI